MTATNVIVTVDVRGAEVRHHCAHDNGLSSFTVGSNVHPVTVYLLGTLEQVSEFAHTLAAVVAREAVGQVEAAAIAEAK